MLTHFDGLCSGRHGQRHHGISPHRQPHQTQVRLGCHTLSEQADARGAELAAALVRAHHGAVRQWHAAAEAAAAETSAEGLTYCFLGGPEVQERFDFVGLAAHPGEFGRVEPAVGQAGDLEGAAVFEVDADGAVSAGGDGYQVVGVADAHRQRIGVWPAGLVVTQHRPAAEQRLGQVQKQLVSGGAGILAGRGEPDVRGFQIGARRVNHRKKVSR
jgi:hypothetical protein